MGCHSHRKTNAKVVDHFFFFCKKFKFSRLEKFIFDLKIILYFTFEKYMILKFFRIQEFLNSRRVDI